MSSGQCLSQETRSGGELAPRRFESLLPLAPQTATLTLGRHILVVDTFNHLEDQRLDDTMASKNVDDIDIETGSELFTLRNDIKRRESSKPRDLECVRERLHRLDTKERRLFEEYCGSITSPFLSKLKEDSDETRPMDWAGWLSEQADNGQLVNFLQWHNHAMEQVVQRPEIAKEIDRQKSEYKQGIAAGIAEGWLHPETQPAIELTDSIQVHAGDLFGTTFEEIGGYYRRGSREVVAAAIGVIPHDGDYEDIRKQFKRITKHELNHAVLGSFEVRWLDEAVTEHIAQVMEDGNPDKLSPWKRRYRPGGGYVHERDLLSILLEAGSEEIPVKMATRAYSELGDSGPERTAFINAVNSSWSHLVPEGGNAYKNLNKYIEDLERHYREEEGLKQIAAGKKAAEEVAWMLKAYKMLKTAEADPKQNWRLAGFKGNVEERVRQIFSGGQYQPDREMIAA
ncbi:MAG TPA: hypothetical protein VFX86_04110 [Candidatus Saccharimonadales bacterium]|nr:hypothetical protein [Candidatus Saccharimonadales bacterium]